MPQTAAQRPRTPRRLRPALIPLAVAAVAVTAALAYQSEPPPSVAGTQTRDLPHAVPPSASSSAPVPDGLPQLDPDPPASRRHDRLGEDDGVLPAGVTALDDGHAGVANLDRDLLIALRRATRAAARDGIPLEVTSGWRSPAYQAALLREAVSEYGSEREAARWVATVDTSPHVSGHAVDIGSGIATEWLATHGAAYGLCRIYRNEPWHFELRPEAPSNGCPRMYADPTVDPRMRG